MNKRNKLMSGMFWSAVLLLLILDSRTALTAASEGMMLCLRTVVPSVLPFIFIGSLLSVAISDTKCAPIEKLLNIPRGGIGYFLTGLICGYPVGAKTLQDAYRSGKLSQSAASRMCCYCNNAGPAFMIGMLASVFSSWKISLLLWLIQILSAVITGILLPCAAQEESTEASGIHVNLQEQMSHTLLAVGCICGWVILFKIIISYLNIWILRYLPPLGQVLLSGIFELTNGLCVLHLIESDHIRFTVASAMLGFGGLCVYFQTKSVAPDLVAGKYALAKLFHSAVASALAMLTGYFLFGASQSMQKTGLLIIAVICVLMMTFYFNKKVVAFSR